MAKQYIKIRGANEHNLKNISIDIPRNELVVLTGLSGSGKSSLAFDTIYAEGQRRYMESLSSYARQFLGQMEKPDVESIEGLSPAISIDQKSTNRNPRSTVGTVTEIYDYMRLLYARIGIPHCPKCGREIRRQTVDQMVDQIMALPERTKIQLLAPVVRGRKGRHEKVLEQAKKSGYVRVRVDGSLYELSEEITLDKNIKHNIEIVVDRLVVKPGIEKRLSDSIETVMGLSNGLMLTDTAVRDENGEEKHDTLTFSQNFSCPDCGISVDEVEPRSFSFNNPFGACPDCFGLGYKMEFDEDLMIPDKSLSINQGAITAMGWQSCTDKSSYTRAVLDALAEEYDFSLRETETYEIIDDVAKMKSEIGILYLNSFNKDALMKIIKSKSLTFTELFTAKPHVFVSTDHPLADKKSVTMEELADYPYLSFEQGEHNSFYYSEEIFSTVGRTKNIRVTDRATLFNLLIGLNGYTVCSGVIDNELNGDNITAIPLDEEGNMKIGYIENKKILHSNLAEAYIEALKKHI